MQTPPATSTAKQYRFLPDSPALSSLPISNPPLLPGESLEEYSKMINGEPYIAVDPFLMRSRELCVAKCEKFNGTGLSEADRREMLVGWATLSGGEDERDGVHIMKPFTCEYGFNLKFGKEIYLGPGCTLIDVSPIQIGSRSMLGANVQIYTPTHPLSPEERNGLRGPEGSKPLCAASTGTDCWIGAGAMILPGITIGDGATVGAGSVVTKDVPSRTVVVGNPARAIKRIEKDGTVVSLK